MGKALYYKKETKQLLILPFHISLFSLLLRIWDEIGKSNQFFHLRPHLLKINKNVGGKRNFSPTNFSLKNTFFMFQNFGNFF